MKGFGTMTCVTERDLRCTKTIIITLEASKTVGTIDHYAVSFNDFS
jgi:hypothetical protein